MATCAKYRPKEISDPNNLYFDKTWSRLKKFSQENNVDLEAEWRLNGKRLPNIRTIAEESAKAIRPPSQQDISLCHGDFCLSNILYNFRTQSIKVIDPRGMNFDGKISLYGDKRYDLVKLAHSVLAGYDHIVCGYYRYTSLTSNNIEFDLPFDKNTQDIQSIFRSMPFLKDTIDNQSMHSILINLFLSMLPLHKDNKSRQHALLANALRLYNEAFNL